MKSMRTLLSALLVLGILAAVFLMDIPTFMMIKRGEIKDYDTAAPGSFEVNQPVKGTIDMTLGACAERYQTKFGIKISSSSTLQYYVLWMPNDQFILYETGDKDEYKTLDRICDETAAYFKSLNEAKEADDPAVIIPTSTTLSFEGVVKKPSSEIMKYFKEYYDEAFDDGEFDTYAEPLMISHKSFSSFTGTVIAGLICAALFVVLGIVTLIVWRKNRNMGY